MTSTLIQNGILANASTTYAADILIQGEKIAAVGKDLPSTTATRVVDAAGMYVLPGAVDGHVHMMDPGHTDREDFITGTMAAARGGVTTVIEHHRSEPQTFDAELFEEKRRYLAKRSCVDFALMGGLNLSNVSCLKEMWDVGAVTFKGFTCYLHGAEALLSGDLIEIMKEVNSFNGVIQLHCEDDSVLKKNEKRLKAEGRKDPESVANFRSIEAEKLSVLNVIELAKITGAKVIVAHVSLPELVRSIADARRDGVRVYSESCGQYFFLTLDDLRRNGPFNKFTPPPREKNHVEGMWQALNAGLVDMVNTDHCPFPYHEKEAGLEDIWQAPFGIPGIETTTRVLLNGCAEGKIDLCQVVRVRSENPAKIYGLSHCKGYLLPGFDADLILVDLDCEETLRNEDVISKCKWTPFAGRRIKGDIAMTMVRGNILLEGGKVSEQPGWGKFVSRSDVSVA